VYVAFLDEKFFYITSRRKFLKKLPKAAHEEVGCERFVLPKRIPRRFPVKCMFLGVVGQPVPHHGFHGKILLERVSEEVGVSWLTSHTNLSDVVILNWKIKNGNWG